MEPNETPGRRSDREILDLFFAKNEDALKACGEKYGNLLYSIALSILDNAQDAEETVNDVLLRLWNAIPPERPIDLRAYAARICRNRALDLAEKNGAQKRGGGQILSELSESIPARGVDGESDQELARLIDAFLRTLPKEQRAMFIRRYWFGCGTDELARTFGCSVNGVKSKLQRIRKKLKSYLEKDGVNV